MNPTVIIGIIGLLAVAALAIQHVVLTRRHEANVATIVAIRDETEARLADDLADEQERRAQAEQDANDWRNMHVVEQHRACANAAETDVWRRAFTAKVLKEAREELVHPDAPWGQSNVVVIDEARIRRDLGLPVGGA